MAQLFKHTALISFFGLLISLICWITLGEHGEHYPTFFWLIIALIPLLFPLRGLLHGRAYTHAWNSFLMLFYFTHGVGEFYSAEGFSLYPFLELLFSLVTFISSIVFIKLAAISEKAKTN